MGFENMKKSMLWFYSNYIFAMTEMSAHIADRLALIFLSQDYQVDF